MRTFPPDEGHKVLVYEREPRQEVWGFIESVCCGMPVWWLEWDSPSRKEYDESLRRVPPPMPVSFYI